MYTHPHLGYGKLSNGCCATYQKFSKEYAGYTKFKISEEVSLPCYDLSSSEELDCLFEFVIKYYGEEENE